MSEDVPKTSETRPRDKDHLVSFRFAGQHFSYKISTLALLMMLAGILMPSVMYSLQLRDPSAADLLVAICIAVFASVLFLWILDVTAILPFQSKWVSRSIWVTGIAAIIGTSVGVYKNTFSARQYPLEGLWEVTIWRGLDGELVDRKDLILMYSTSADTYWGYSDARSLKSSPSSPAEETATANDTLRRILWFEVERLDESDRLLVLRLYEMGGDETLRIENLSVSPRKTKMEGTSGTAQTVGEYKVIVARPK